LPGCQEHSSKHSGCDSEVESHFSTNSLGATVIKLVSAAAFAVALSTSAIAAPNAVATPATECNEAQLKTAQNAVDSIKDPAKQSAAQAELKAAEAALQSNDPSGCMAHLTASQQFVTP
jgi:hypothetical protein